MTTTLAASCLLSLLASLAAAASPAGPPAQPSPPEAGANRQDTPGPNPNPGSPGFSPGGPRDRDHSRSSGGSGSGSGDWRGGYPGRPPMRSDGFDKLPEPEKQKVRAALDKVWSRPEVMEARDRVMKANEDFREAIRVALKAIDPEAAAIVERIRPPDHFDPRQLPKLPPPDSPEFPAAAVARLEMEMMAYSRPDRHEETRRLHERVVALPEIKDSIGRMENSRGEARIEAMQKLRERYRELVMEEFRKAREKRGPGGGDKPSGAPPPPGPGPGSGSPESRER